MASTFGHLGDPISQFKMEAYSTITGYWREPLHFIVQTECRDFISTLTTGRR